RFLTARGWKHVIGAEWGPLQRPHLTPGLRLLGPGGCVAAPTFDDEYKRGSLCGLIRGDGNLDSYSYAPRPGRSKIEVQYRFRLDLADREALNRASVFLAELGVVTDEFAFAAAAGAHRAMTAIRTQTRGNFEHISEAVRWPVLPNASWMKGFLAGIFDAEG